MPSKSAIIEKHFQGEPILRMLGPQFCGRRRQRYILLNDFTYISPSFGEICVMAGLDTDFASVPAFLGSYLSSEDPVIAWPALVHDHLYLAQGRLPVRTLTRAECDWVLREAMLICGARFTQAAVVYRAVRLFGGSRWKTHDEDLPSPYSDPDQPGSDRL